jgi:outer membrane protein assembly factor BamB
VKGAWLLTLVVTGASAAASAQAGADDWPQFLGEYRNGKSSTPVTATLPEEGPQVLWRRSVGEGFAGPVVAEGRVILFHRVGDEEVVEALEATTGETLWRAGYPTSYRDDFGFDEGPRSAATVADGVVFTCGAQGTIQALDLESGEQRWLVDGRTQFRPEKGFFGAACSPLVAAGNVMLNLGGRDGAGIVAIDVASGALAWKATDHAAGYSAPLLADLGSGSRALFFTRRGLVDLDPATGAVRAELPWQSRSRSSVNAASPVIVDGRVFLSASYGTGAALLQPTADGFDVVWSGDEIMTNHYATTIHDRGTLFGFHGRQERSPALRAVDAATGEVLWSVDRFGAGTILQAGETLVVLREAGELVLADASREAFRPTARAQVLARVVRAYPALSGGVLYARNERELAAFDLRRR